MKNEQQFIEVMELIKNELWHDDVYAEVEGNWVNLDFENIEIGIEMWNGIITIYDKQKRKEIYRVE